VYSLVVGDWIAYTAGSLLEIRCDGTDIELWYKNAQVGATQTVDQATINSNKYHGMFSTDGGNSLDSFFSVDPTEQRTVFIGGSNTIGSSTYGFRVQIGNAIAKIASGREYMVAEGGTDSWYGLTRLDTYVTARDPKVVFIEFAVNDTAFISGGGGTDRANGWWPCQEAMIRRLRTDLPNARLVFVNLVQQEDYVSAAAVTSRDNWRALCTKYGIENFNIDTWLQGVIGTETPTEEQCRVYGDFVHFTEAGHNEITNMLEPHLSSWYPNKGAGWTGDLEDYGDPLYADAADFMETPIVRTGVDNDGETGTGWADDGTARVSSTADDTISWTGTFAAFGIGITAQVGGFQWSIDGGAYSATINQTAASAVIRPLYATDRDVHTVTIKVVSGTVKITGFLAV
jgi:lysophospholipase L1-like esterase